MRCTLESIRNREVIEITTGERLGYIDDVEMNLSTGEIISLIIYGRERFFGIFGREEDIILNCGEIEVIGEDIILIKKENICSSAKSIKTHRKC